MTESNNRRVRSLAELPREIAPRRDLWAGVEAAISAPAAAPRQASRRVAVPWLPLGLAASLAAFASFAWIGRESGAGAAARLATTPARSSAPQMAAPTMLAASFALDEKSSAERQLRLNALAGQLVALPVETQLKIKASLALIEKSVLDIQAALGRDPGNLLLQEMLVNSYQDEMRVLGAVDEAKRATLEQGL